MPTPPLPSLDELLEPIPGPNPAGEDLEYEAVRGAIADARRWEERPAVQSEEAQRRDVWDREYKEADYRKVIELAVPALRDRSKDLMIAAWLAEALAHEYGLGGLDYGLRLMHGIHDRFWDHFWPAKDDDDPEMRHGPYLFLEGEKNVIRALRLTPLSGGKDARPFSLGDYEQAQFWATHPAVAGAQEFSSQDILEALRKTPWVPFHEQLDAELVAAIASWKAFIASIDERFGLRDAPPTDRLTAALEGIQTLLQPVFKEKRPAAPVAPAAAAAASSPAPGAPAHAGAAAPAAIGAIPAQPGEIPVAAGPIESSAAAIGAILAGAGYLRQADSSDPTPYLLVRALGMGAAYNRSRWKNSPAPPAPPSQHRQALRRLASAGDWEQALALAEAALGQPTGWAWLDAQRHALSALEKTGRDAAAKAARALLRATLADFPELARAELDDDTPAANHETRAWIENELLPPGRDNGADEARILLQAGRAREAVAALDDAINRARSGRERFLRKLELAELFLELNQPRAAKTHLEELKARIDEKQLDQWEEKALCVRTYQALRAAHRALDDEAAAQEAFERICRWDPSLALE